MRILAAIVVALFIATLFVVVSNDSSVAAGAGTSLAAGDQLVYEITVELQQHHTIASPKPHDNAMESSAQGSETFSIYAIGQDGTAYAKVDASFQGTAAGRPFESHTTTTAKVMPDGRLRVKNQLGLGISDAVSFANTTAAELAQRILRVGSVWTTKENTQFVRLTLLRRVAGRKAYQGVSAYEVQSLGSGQLLRTSDGTPAVGTVAISSTSYYDAKHHLFIGEALRTLTVIQQPQAATGHDSYSATMNLVLSSWTHSSPAPSVAAPGPTGSPATAQTAAPPSPAPIQSIFGPTPYPTVTPRLAP